MPIELDHHLIKAELKEYLSKQVEFTDYNFEGSNLSFLLDILAYNTHYNALYANMIINEQFLDSAIKRANVVSLAKHLGYVPRSSRAAGVLIDLGITKQGDTSFTIPQFTTFTGEKIVDKERKSIPFVTMSAATAFSPSGNFEFENIELRQGKIVTWNFTVTEEDQKFTLPSSEIDLTTLQVLISPIATSEFQRYEKGNYFRGYGPDSHIYFVEENSDGYYTLYFGDGIIGRRVEPGYVITARYLVTKGLEGNEISNFTSSLNTNYVRTVDNSKTQGGESRESVASVKFNAPRFYSSQGRAITPEDYRSIILSEIPQIESINVWGGDTETPPQYGKVFISIKPVGIDRVSRLLENEVYNILKNRGVVSILPVLVDPDYTYVGFTIRALYNRNIIANRRTVQENLFETIKNFFQLNLQTFDADFKYSKFIKALDVSSDAIESVTADITLQKRIITQGLQHFTFNNKILPGTIRTPLHDQMVFGLSRTGSVIDKEGVLLFQTVDSKNAINIGTIDYNTGIGQIKFDRFVGFNDAVSTKLRLTANIDLESRNISTKQNQILIIDDSSNGVNIIVEDTTLA